MLFLIKIRERRKMKLLMTVFLMGFMVMCVSAQKITYTHDKSVDFSLYKSFAWAGQEMEEVPMANIVPDIKQFDTMLKDSVNKVLWDKGFVSMAEEGKADFLLVYHITITPESSTQNVYQDSPMSNTRFDPVWVVSGIKGALYIDVIDVKSDKRVWHGRASNFLIQEQQIDPQKRKNALMTVSRRCLKSSRPNRDQLSTAACMTPIVVIPLDSRKISKEARAYE